MAMTRNWWHFFALQTQTTQFVQLYAIKEMYEKSPDKQWYLIYGCDNYVNVDYMLEMLDEFDPAKPTWLAVGGIREPLPDWVDKSKYPKNANSDRCALTCKREHSASSSLRRASHRARPQL